MKVSNEQVFGVPTTSFGVGYSLSGYTLEYSADGENFTPWHEPTPANEVLIVNGAPKGFSYRLKDNVGDVYVQY